MSGPALLRAAATLRGGCARAAAVMAHLAGWNYVLCALFITGDIVIRNLPGVSSAATVEITGYMLAVGIAWSLAHALATCAHIRVDLLANRLPQRWLGKFGQPDKWISWLTAAMLPPTRSEHDEAKPPDA